MKELVDNSYILLIPLFFGVVFLISWFIERRRLLNGLLFNLFLGSFLFGLLGFGISANLSWLLVLVVLIIGFLLLILLFGIYVLIIFLFINARQVLKRESRSLSNMLTLMLAIVLTVFIIIRALPFNYPTWFEWLFGWATLVGFYLLVVFANFFTASFLYQFNRPALKQDYIIVLGAGLLDGKRVPPLLAKRIEKAMSFYHKQFKATGTAPQLLMSGGKGGDEALAEGAAMAQYAKEHGIPPQDILIEDKSTDTTENMRFSKYLMDQKSGDKPYRAIFCSNNFHIFRASLDARDEGLKANGIGCKTAFYYLPNAFLREFAAILVMNKERHVFFVGVMTFVSFALEIIQAVNG